MKGVGLVKFGGEVLFSCLDYKLENNEDVMEEFLGVYQQFLEAECNNLLNFYLNTRISFDKRYAILGFVFWWEKIKIFIFSFYFSL